MKFTLKAEDIGTKARAGFIETSHGEIETPIFMPVATTGAIKAVHHHELEETVKAQIILGNTYHLFLRPGMKIISEAGGLHKFMNWKKPLLTDSGGYQIFSLAEKRKIKEEGATFQSHIDGTKYLFTPENVMDIQRQLGSDIMMAFDECPPYPSEHAAAKKSMQLTHRWLARCVKRVEETEPLYGNEQSLFPIIQGSTFKDLRKDSAEYVSQLNLDGNAIGGLSVGEPAELMYEMTEMVCDILPKNKPRYLMGVGTPANILECISLGIDMFDCVMPTRNARNGMLFTQNGIININNKKWENDFSPLDETMNCFASKDFSKAYIKHLLHAHEMLGAQLASIHNLTFYLWLVREARQHILAGDFESWKKTMLMKVTTRL